MPASAHGQERVASCQAANDMLQSGLCERYRRSRRDGEQREVQRLQAENQNLLREKNRAVQRLRQLQQSQGTSRTRAQGDIQRLRNENQQLRQGRTTTEQKLERLRSENTTLRSERDSAVAKVRQLEQQRETQGARSQRAQGNIQRLRDEIRDLKLAKSNAEAQLGAAKAKNSALGPKAPGIRKAVRKGDRKFEQGVFRQELRLMM